MELKTIECLIIELFQTGRKSILIETIYKPPHTPIVWFEYFNEMLSKHTVHNNEILIMGDFNEDLHSYYLASNHRQPIHKLLEIASDYGLKRLIKNPTRKTATSETIIDLIFTSDNAVISEAEVLKLNMSDHFPVKVIWKNCANHSHEKHKHHIIHYRRMKIFSE